MKELFILNGVRGSGAGRALMRKIAEHATALNAQSVRWETGEAAARGFYRNLGAEDDGKTQYTLLPDAYDNFAR